MSIESVKSMDGGKNRPSQQRRTPATNQGPGLHHTISTAGRLRVPVPYRRTPETDLLVCGPPLLSSDPGVPLRVPGGGFLIPSAN